MVSPRQLFLSLYKQPLCCSSTFFPSPHSRLVSAKTTSPKMIPSSQLFANVSPSSKIPRLLKPAHAWSEPRTMEMKQVQNDLNKAFQSAFPTHPSQYKGAIALLFHFDNDDRGIESLEQELGKVFKECYGYEVKHVTLHSTKNPTVDLKAALLDLERQGWYDASNLIILVFSGHGELATDKKIGRTESAHRVRRLLSILPSSSSSSDMMMLNGRV
jgi:hypothetical protein